MNLAEYIVEFLRDHGAKYVFTVSGGANLHLLNVIDSTNDISYICTQHEQAAAMAANAYARIGGKPGVATTTSGPGAVNLLNGVCSSFFDSIPSLLITGQVTSARLRGQQRVRQIGFQETDIVGMFRHVTKYAKQLTAPSQIQEVLELAYNISLEGRPGPVLVDIPDDFWTKEIRLGDSSRFPPHVASAGLQGNLDRSMEKCLSLITASSRPVLILGNGVHASNALKEVSAVIDALQIPVVTSRSACDVLHAKHPLNVGTFGIHGTRAANFAVQNSDFLLSIGARLHPQQTGNPPSTFARAAKKVVVDVDLTELDKFDYLSVPVEEKIHADAKYFLDNFLPYLRQNELPDFDHWLTQIADWIKRYSPSLPALSKGEEVNPYFFIRTLSEILENSEIIVSSAGNSLPWINQIFSFKSNQRYIADFNHFSMGYDLPGSIGASFAAPNKQVICITGDGSIQMNLQELATIRRHELPVKIFVLDNHCYAMINQTQDQWFNSNYFATTFEGGLPDVDLLGIAAAYGLSVCEITCHENINSIVRNFLDEKGPGLCRVAVPAHYRVVPQVKAGRPIEDTEPLLEREEFLKNMIVEPIS